jgi:hypothetical protein
MAKAPSEKKAALNNVLVPVAVKLPASLHDKICGLAQYVQGGKSEVIRRCIVTGLPIVIQQRGIHIPAKGGHK